MSFALLRCVCVCLFPSEDEGNQLLVQSRQAETSWEYICVYIYIHHARSIAFYHCLDSFFLQCTFSLSCLHFILARCKRIPVQCPGKRWLKAATRERGPSSNSGTRERRMSSWVTLTLQSGNDYFFLPFFWILLFFLLAAKVVCVLTLSSSRLLSLCVCVI